MNLLETIKEYYSKWLGVSIEMMNSKGVFFVESTERDKKQTGYSSIFDVYVYTTDSLVIVSYSKRLSGKIKKAKSRIHSVMRPDDISNILEETFNTTVRHSIKFYYDKMPEGTDTSNVRRLLTNDFPKYLEFYLALYPKAKVQTWLEEYFCDITKRELAYGVFENDKLVTVADAPSMPYMGGKVQEIGIYTLPDYRKMGYARSAVLADIKNLIGSDKCPLWSCDINNTASEKLAYSVGFRKLAEVLVISF